MKQINFISLISGLLYGLSYPFALNMPTGVLAWFALVPMLLSLREATTFKQFCFKTFPVLFIGTYIFGAFVFAFGTVAGLVTCFSQCILTFLPLILHFFIQKRIGWQRSMWLLPTVWTIGDWGQHLMPHSFQISSIAYTQTTVLWFAQLADVFGMWGITFWVVAVNVSIALTIDSLKDANVRETFKVSRTWYADLPPLSIFIKKWSFQGLILFGLPLIYAFWSNLNLPNGRSIKVALVQTNEDSKTLLDSIQLNKNLTNLIRLADSAAQTKPDLMVFPESALHFPVLQDTLAFRAVRNYVLNWGTAVAVGFPEYPDTANRRMYYNAAFVFTPSLAYVWDSLQFKMSDLKVYHKQNPLPIAEMMPYGDVLGIKGKVLPTGGGETLQGNAPYVFSFPDRFDHEIKTSATICWEQFFPETQAELTLNGAQFLTQMNNDGWFGNSSGGAQLLNKGRLRAIENRRTIARCSNTGISGFIDPFGRLYGQLKTQSEGVNTEGVILNSELTVFSRYGNWFPKALMGVLLVGLLFFGKLSEIIGFMPQNRLS
jgi:apolipoprotein N-acyltransferase